MQLSERDFRSLEATCDFRVKLSRTTSDESERTTKSIIDDFRKSGACLRLGRFEPHEKHSLLPQKTNSESLKEKRKPRVDVKLVMYKHMN
jgi:hypothetical protein